MVNDDLTLVAVDRQTMTSIFLKREVRVDIYHAALDESGAAHLLLINDGQDLVTMGFNAILQQVHAATPLQPLLCVGIHANEERRMEYGTANATDFNGRGAKAPLYNRFIIEELLPWLGARHSALSFRSVHTAGFSLGGLTAIDMAWNYPSIFSSAGVFSGSLWWRSKDLANGYDEDKDRIMHQQVRNGSYVPGLRFYFTTGSLDETADRNNNGIIDSIDDTLSLIEELTNKGYPLTDITYVNFEDGRHDIHTWARALPQYLQWGWARPPEMPAESC